MTTEYAVENLLDFLGHAGERGLMPQATAQALSVACRNVFGVLADDERADLRAADLDGIIKRFNNKRARDFNPTSLKEYGRRAHRSVELFLKWRENPAEFSVKTRASSVAKAKERNGRPDQLSLEEVADRPPAVSVGGYQSGFPIRPGRVVTILNVPDDLTSAEAERLATFVRMLAVS
jgi:hypothetical protein